MKMIAILLALSVLAGCGSSRWTKVGATKGEESRTEAACRRNAGADNDDSSNRAEEMAAICMEAAGWSENN